MDPSLQQQYGIPIGSYYDSGSGYVVDTWGNPLGTPEQFGGTQPNGPGGEWTFPTQAYVESPQYGQVQVNASAQQPAAANIGDFTTGANALQQQGLYPGPTDYEGVSTTFYDRNGKLAYWYGDMAAGGSTTHDSGSFGWHSVNELQPQQGIDSSGNTVTFTPNPRVAKAKEEDPQLKTGITGAAGVLASVLAPEILPGLIGSVGSSISEAFSVSAETAKAIATAVVKGVQGSLTSALGGASLSSALESGAISSMLPSVAQGVSDSLTSMGISAETAKSLTGVAMQTMSGALKGGLSGGAQGAEIGALTGAATGAAGEAAGALGSSAMQEFNPPQTMEFLGTEYVLDDEGNFVLNQKGDPMTLQEYQDTNKQAFSTFAQKVGAPFISQDVSNLFATPAEPQSQRSSTTTSSGAYSSNAPASSKASASSPTPTPTMTGNAVYSTPTFSTGGSTLTGSPSTQQGAPGTQALAQALNIGNPASATSDTGDSSTTNESGGKQQNVWNTASLKVKDAIGSQENV